MTTKAISPLRQRMINDMNVRNFVPDTQREYIRAVKNLTIFLRRSPDTATAEDLRAFQLHMTETGVRPPTINAVVTVASGAIWLIFILISAFYMVRDVERILHDRVFYCPLQISLFLHVHLCFRHHPRLRFRHH